MRMEPQNDAYGVIHRQRYHDEDTDEDGDDDEEYRKFIRFLYDDNVQTDEDEAEEEYQPDKLEECDDSDEEEGDRGSDEDEDPVEGADGLIKVAKNEVQELVNGCWKTILGEPVKLPEEVQIESHVSLDINHNHEHDEMYSSSYQRQYPAANDVAEADMLSVSSTDTQEPIDSSYHTHAPIAMAQLGYRQTTPSPGTFYYLLNAIHSHCDMIYRKFFVPD